MAPRPTVKKKSIEALERSATVGFLEYFEYIRSPGRLFWANVLAGFGRAVGFILGVTVFLTLVLTILSHLAHLPIGGDFFRWVGEQLSAARGVRG